MVVPRTGAIARPLPNGQIIIAGGTTAADNLTNVLELYTPPAPDR